MNLAEKLKHLREVEGELRGLNRPMTQTEVVKAMGEELHKGVSQAYLSQLESGKRLHLTASSRDLLARFFKVHPGYLVSDPPDYSTDLITDMASAEDRLTTWLTASTADLTTWLTASAAEWRAEPDMYELLLRLADSADAQRYLSIFRKLTELPIEDLEAIVEAVITHGEEEIDLDSMLD